MSDRLIFILHTAEDGDYAARLAASLSPMNAFPMRLREDGAPGAKIGSGGVSLLLWSESFSRTMVGQSIQAVHERFGSDVLICKLRVVDASPQTISLNGDVEADTIVVGEALKALEQSVVDAPGARTPRLGVVPAGGAGGQTHFAARSVFGLAATLSVAGVLAPAVVERAQAVSPASIDEGELYEEPQVDAARLDAARVAPTQLAVVSGTPSLDQWLTEMPEGISSEVLQDEVSSAPQDILLLSVPASSDEVANVVSIAQAPRAFDPKRASFEALRPAHSTKAERVSGPDLALESESADSTSMVGIDRL
jgi:hypothetical protein